MTPCKQSLFLSSRVRRRKGGSGGSTGRGPACPPPLFLHETEARMAENNFFKDRLPSPPATYLKVWTREWEALPESRQDFEVANFWTSQSWFLSSNVFSGCQYPLIDKPMLIIKPTVPSTPLLGVGAKRYPLTSSTSPIKME